MTGKDDHGKCIQDLCKWHEKNCALIGQLQKQVECQATTGHTFHLTKYEAVPRDLAAALPKEVARGAYYTFACEACGLEYDRRGSALTDRDRALVAAYAKAMTGPAPRVDE